MLGLRSPRLTTALLTAAPFALLLALYLGNGFLPFGSARAAVATIVGLTVYAWLVHTVSRHGQDQIRRLEELALTDSLCGLRNRRGLHADIGRAGKAGEEVAIALLDLDAFKAVNDFYGHAVGDRVIKECARILEGLCEGVGQAYRLGGDEFAIVVNGPLAGNILEGICRRLLARLNDPVKIDDRAIALGASIGLARGQSEEAGISSTLLRQADVAMYAAKSRGKGRITWFNGEFDTNRDMRQSIDQDLRTALAEGHLRMHYQPLIDSKTGLVSAVEALIRWERPDGQRIGPDKFIPIAEETGLIEAIGLWVLRKSCIEAKDWEGIRLSVNVSVAQLRNPQFPLQLAQILEETEFPAARLELEVTETFLVGDPVIAKRNLEMLRDFGVSIVLDDYGTGYASIGFLRRFRFEKLKLDRSLIVDAASDDATRVVMASSVTMAKALGMKVTAEGIETETHANLARTAGCDQMQGWLYSKAVPAEELSQQLDAQKTPDRPAQNQRRRAAG